MRIRIVATFALAAFICGCAKDRDSVEDKPAITAEQANLLVQNIADKQIVVAVNTFSEEVKELHDDAETFCRSLDGDDLPKAQASWRGVASAWYRLQLFNFGPADADPIFPIYTFIDSLRLRGTDYRETVTSRLEEWGNSEDELDEEFFVNERFQNVGLLAIEVALYDGELAEAPEGGQRRCEVLMGLSEQLKRRSDELTSGWTDSYEDADSGFMELLKDNRLPSGRDSFAQILISAQEYLDYLHKRSVVTVAGQTSGTSWLLVGEALSAIEDLLEEDFGEESILDTMKRLGADSAVDTVERDLKQARLALEAEHVASLRTALLALDGDFKHQIPDSLGVELGITWTDGD